MALLDMFRIVRLTPRISQLHSAPRRYRPCVELLEDRMVPSTFSVTNTNDSGPGSLRAAIMSVNADPGPSTDGINFTLAQSTPQTIHLASPLPTITHSVKLFGYINGFVSSPIELDGSAFLGRVSGVAGISIQATSSVSPFECVIQGFKIDNFVTGIRIDNRGSSAPARIELDNNEMEARAGGAGIIFLAGTGVTTGRIFDNDITTRGAADGIDVETAGTMDEFWFGGNEISTTVVGDAIRVSGDAKASTLTFFQNHLSAQAQGASFGAIALNVTLSRSSRADVDITENEFRTSNTGTGLVLQGGAAFQARVQRNNFDFNRLGVNVFGDGVTAGNVDLGGGSLGSTGGNNFTSYRDAGQPFKYAIGLFNVAPGYTMRAMRNEFRVSPSLVIADGSHDPGAGGSGTILTSDAIVAVGAEAGNVPEVRVFDAATGALKFDFLAYDAGFRGGVRVAVGDVNGDGTPDIITGAGPGGGSHVKVFDGATGAEIRSFLAYAGFTGGVSVAAADLNGDGFADIITGAGVNGHVKVFDGQSGALIRSFLAYPGFTGAVSVAAGDVNGDGLADVITGASVNGHVKVFDGRTEAVLRSFLAYAGWLGGVFVGAGDLDGDGKAEILTGVAGGGPAHVKVFAGASGDLLASFYADGASNLGGVRVGAEDVDGDGRVDILTEVGAGAGRHVKAFRASDLAELDSFFALSPALAGGVLVG